MQLEKNTRNKNKIKQKMNLEIAKFYLSRNENSLAKKFAAKALKIETTIKKFDLEAREIYNKNLLGDSE
jgi:hypothetical protein